MVERWQREDGKPLTLTRYFTPADDPAALVRQAAENPSDAVVHTGVEPLVIAWSKAWSAAAWPANWAARQLPLYAMAEFEPWSSRSPSRTDWRNAMQKGKVPLSSFSQAADTAAQLFVRTLRGMQGDVTRARVRTLKLSSALWTTAHWTSRPLATHSAYPRTLRPKALPTALLASSSCSSQANAEPLSVGHHPLASFLAAHADLAVVGKTHKAAASRLQRLVRLVSSSSLASIRLRG